MYAGINTRLEKEMIQLAPLIMEIKVIDESERKYSFQQRNIISSQFILKNNKFNSLFYLLFDILFVYFYVDEFLCVWIDFCFVKWINAK